MLKRIIGDEEEPPSPRTRSWSRINGDDVSSSVHYGTVDELRLLVSKRKRETRRSCCGWQSIVPLVAAVHLLVACAITLIARTRLEHLGDSVIIALQKTTEKKSVYMWMDILGVDPAMLMYFIPAYIYYGAGKGGRALAERLLLLNACTRLVKWLIDIMVRQGRPFWISSRIHMWHCPSAYGFPSGHASLWLVFLVPTTLHASTTYKYTTAVINIIFFAFILLTRLYVGTHYPHSLLSGIALGVLMVTTISAKVPQNIRRFVDDAEDLLTSLVDTIGRRLVLAAIAVAGATVMALMIAISVGLVTLVKRYGSPDPAVWSERAANSTLCSSVPLDTLSLEPAFEALGALGGIFAGIIAHHLVYGSSQDLQDESEVIRAGFALTQMIIVWAIVNQIPKHAFAFPHTTEDGAVDGRLVGCLLCQFAGSMFAVFGSAVLFRMPKVLA